MLQNAYFFIKVYVKLIVHIYHSMSTKMSLVGKKINLPFIHL